MQNRKQSRPFTHCPNIKSIKGTLKTVASTSSSMLTIWLAKRALAVSLSNQSMRRSKRSMGYLRSLTRMASLTGTSPRCIMSRTRSSWCVSRGWGRKSIIVWKLSLAISHLWLILPGRSMSFLEQTFLHRISTKFRRPCMKLSRNRWRGIRSFYNLNPLVPPRKLCTKVLAPSYLRAECLESVESDRKSLGTNTTQGPQRRN